MELPCDLSGDRMSELANFEIGLSSSQKELGDMKNNLKCKHDIIAEWCSTCKRMDTPSIKQVLLQENLEIVRNLLSWPSKNGNRTT